MSMDNRTVNWELEDIDAMLELLPIVSSPTFLSQFTGSSLVGPFQDTAPTLSEFSEEFHRLVYRTSAFIAPYDPLPEDWHPNGVPFHVMGVSCSFEYLENATLNQIRRFLVLCTRGERFCTNYFQGQIVDGYIEAALRRLSILRQAMSEDADKE